MTNQTTVPYRITLPNEKQDIVGAQVAEVKDGVLSFLNAGLPVVVYAPGSWSSYEIIQMATIRVAVGKLSP